MSKDFKKDDWDEDEFLSATELCNRLSQGYKDIIDTVACEYRNINTIISDMEKIKKRGKKKHNRKLFNLNDLFWKRKLLNLDDVFWNRTFYKFYTRSGCEVHGLHFDKKNNKIVGDVSLREQSYVTNRQSWYPDGKVFKDDADEGGWDLFIEEQIL